MTPGIRDKIKDVPQDGFNDVPLELVVFDGHHRSRNTKAISIGKLGEDLFWKKKVGLKYTHLIENGFAKHKDQAQAQLKRCVAAKVLFTWGNKRPQRYYPTSIKSVIMNYLLSENVPIDPSGVTSSLKELIQDLRLQTLLDYVLPLLPKSPLLFHNPHLMFKVKPEYYNDLNVSQGKGNKGKRHEYPMYRGLLSCTLYPNGTIDLHVKCSNKPFRLETYDDVGRLLVFLGQVKAFVMEFLNDPKERTIPDVMDWVLTECDINKDIHVSEAFQVAGLQVQVKIRIRDFLCMLAIYFKLIAANTVCRVETRGVRVGMHVGQIVTGIFGLRDYVPEN